MGPTGHLVTIKRSGVDGPHFPLSLRTCLFGRGIECDIRIQLPVVSKQHCKIEVKEQEAILYNLSSTNPTRVNGSAIEEPVQLKHGDLITIVDRSFRYEKESRSNESVSTEFPGQKHEQKPSRRVSRSSFSSAPDGKDQDSNTHSKLTEGNVSGSPLVHVKKVKGDSTASPGSKDTVAQEIPSIVHSSEYPAHNGKKARDPTSGVFEERFRVTTSVTCLGELKSFPSTQSLNDSKKSESPFRKLYQSMKEELDVKSQKENVQYHRKSGSQTECTIEKESTDDLQRETQLLVSRKSRRKSGKSTPIKVDLASPEQETSRTEGNGTDMEPAHTFNESVSSSIPLSETTKMKTPVRYSKQQSLSQKHKNEDLYITAGREPVILDKSESFKANDKRITPRKLLYRTQTPTKFEGAANSGNKSGNLSSKNKGSMPASVEVLPAETEPQNQRFVTLSLVQAERKIQKDSLNEPEKLGTPAGQFCSGVPGLSSVDVSNFDDPINKCEGMSLTRRRVSFGGHLRPELFDENLPPNTPLKRGETPSKRQSLVAHTPTVLKKIIKEQPQPTGKEESSEVCLEGTAQNVFTSSPAPSPGKTPAASDQRRRSCKASPISSRGKSPHQTDVPRGGGRKSGNLPSKRTSIGRSKHDILQMICSKRRSGASEANLIVAKSWADVVKLGAKQTQTKVIKHGPQKPPNKRRIRPDTPKKPMDSVHNQFSTGHANSPCTIVIGKAHTEKVNVPARPYRMLNSFVFNQKMDLKEDLSGITEMFKTPEKETSQMLSTRPVTLSHSENLLGEKFPATDSGENPLLPTSGSLGENVFSKIQIAEELSDKCSASPTLGQQCINKNENAVKTPRNIYKMTDVEMKTPDADREPLKTVSSANKLRRTMVLRKTQVPPTESSNEETKAAAAENVTGRSPRKMPLEGKKAEGEIEGSERSLETYEEDIQSKENSEKRMPARRSRRTWGQTCAPAADLAVLERLHDAEPMRDLPESQGLLQTPDRTEELMNEEDKTSKIPGKPPQPAPVDTPASTKRQLRTPLGQVDVTEEFSAVRKRTHRSAETTLTHTEPVGDGEGIRVFEETPKQKHNPTDYATGMKTWPRTPKEKTQPLEDLLGFKEQFQTSECTKDPMTDDKITKIPSKSPQSEPADTPIAMKTQPKTPLGKEDVEEELSALTKLTQTSGKVTCSPKAPAGDKGFKAFKGSAKQNLDPAENVTASKRRQRAPKQKTLPLEDLAGFKELFQTPGQAEQSKPVGKTSKTPCRSPQSEPVGTPRSTKRWLKTSVGKVDVKEDLSTLRKLMQASRGTLHTPSAPEGEDKGIRAFMRSPKQKLHPEENLTECTRQLRTPKEKALLLEDLAGFKELFQTPSQAGQPMADGKTSKTTCKSPQPEPVKTPTSSKRRLKTRLGKVDVEEELPALRKLTQASDRAMQNPKIPVDDENDIKAFMGTPKQNLDLAENLTGHKRQPRTPKEKAVPLEDLAGFQDLFQTPKGTREPKTEDKTTKIRCKSPQPEPVKTPASSKRRLKTSMVKVDVEEELPALRKLMQASGVIAHSPKAPAADKGFTDLKESAKQTLDSAASVTGSKKRPRAPKEEAPPLEDLTGLKELFQTPGQGEQPVADEKPSKIPCKSPQAEIVKTSASTKRRLKTSVGKVDMKEEFSAPKKLRQTSGETKHSLKARAGDENVIRMSKESAKQKREPAGNVTASKRQPRAPKEKAQPLRGLAGCRELSQTPGHTEEPRKEAESLKGTPQQTPDREKPLKVLRRVIRAPKVKPVEDLVGPRDLVQSPRKSNTPQSPKRKCGKDTGVRGTKRRRCVTTPLESAEEKPVKKKQRTSPRERCQSPEPLGIMKKSLRKFAKRIEPVEDLSSNMKTEKKEPKVGDSVTPNKGMSLRPRRQNKTDVEQQRPEILVSEEKIEIKTNEKKSMKRSQEVEPRPPDEGAKKPTSTSKVGESGMCLRSSGRQKKIPQPNTDTAEKKIQEKSVGVPRRNQKEKGGAGDSDVICLRSRKIAVHPRVDTLKSESEQRVTRRVKRCAEHPKTDKDAACIKKLRTRSHRDSEDI